MSFDETTDLSRGVFRRLRLGIAALAAVILLAMMGLTVADVLGRYLFSSPVQGSTELTEMLLAAIIFIGLPAASLDGDHIAVDLLTERLRARVKQTLTLVVAVASTVILCVIAWRLWAMGLQIGGYGGTTSTLKLPLAPLAYALSVLTAISAALTFLCTVLEARNSTQSKGPKKEAQP